MTADLDAPDSPPKSGGHGGLTLLVGLLLLGLIYILSPFGLVLLIRIGFPMPSPAVMQTLEVFWFPLKWYTESGIPGGAEYRQALNWLAGSP